MEKRDALRYRIAPLEMTLSEFRKAGSQLVERIAEFLCTLPDRSVTVNELPRVIREVLGTGSLPEEGAEAKDLLEEAADLLFDHATGRKERGSHGMLRNGILLVNVHPLVHIQMEGSIGNHMLIEERC